MTRARRQPLRFGIVFDHAGEALTKPLPMAAAKAAAAQLPRGEVRDADTQQVVVTYRNGSRVGAFDTPAEHTAKSAQLRKEILDMLETGGGTPAQREALHQRGEDLVVDSMRRRGDLPLKGLRRREVSSDCRYGKVTRGPRKGLCRTKPKKRGAR